MELFLTLGYIFFMIIVCIIVILITIATAILKIPVVKGFIGETVIKSIIGKTQPGEKYVVNDLMITDENGKSSQIDHILINRNGIYVIETKNYSGRIYGNNMQHEWTQVLNYGAVKNRFYNPVKQNLTHIYRIREVTRTKIPIKSIVVFVKGNTKYIDSKDVYTPFEMKQEIQKSNFQQLKIKDEIPTLGTLVIIKIPPTSAIRTYSIFPTF